MVTCICIVGRRESAKTGARRRWRLVGQAGAVVEVAACADGRWLVECRQQLRSTASRGFAFPASAGRSVSRVVEPSAADAFSLAALVAFIGQPVGGAL